VTAAWYAAGEGWSREGSRQPESLEERLRFLLDAGLDARECADNGLSLLTEAAGAGDPGRVKLLLERGASPDPGERRWSFETPLFCAAASGSAECVRLILAAGVPADSRDGEGGTALFHAGSPEVARLFLASGADPRTVDVHDYDPLQMVIEGESPFCRRTDSRFGIARLLIEAGADIERRDHFGHTRLYTCAFRRAADAVQFLLEAGAQPFAEQGEGWTPLHAVCWQGDSTAEPELNVACERIIDLLVKAGLPVEARRHQGFTPLLEAAGGDWGNAPAIRALLKHGARPDTPGPTGLTPLMVVAGGGQIECVRPLLEAGADPLRKDHGGRSALDRARRWYQARLASDQVAVTPGLLSEPEQPRSKVLEDASKALHMIESAALGPGGKMA
jgi:ankyrin repeat protein